MNRLALLRSRVRTNPRRGLPRLALAAMLVSGLSAPPDLEAGPARFRRGDTNADGTADMADAIGILRSLFIGDVAIDCLKSADVNRDRRVDIADPVALLGYLFLGQARPPAPFDECGTDEDPGDDPEPLPCPVSQPGCPDAPGGGERVVRLRFPSPSLVRCAGPGGCELDAGGLEPFGEEGDPRLLLRTVRLVLPPDAVAEGLEVSVVGATAETLAVPDGIRPVPGTFAFDEELGEIRGERGDGQIVVDGRNPAVYDEDAFFPSSPVGRPSLVSHRGWRIASFPVYPVLYNPVRQELRAVREIDLRLRWVEIPGSSTADPDTLRRAASGVAELVFEAEVQDLEDVLDLYDASFPVVLPSDLLVITARTILDERADNGLDAFIGHKERLGLRVKTVAVEDIYALYSTGEAWWKIREYIRDREPIDRFDAVLLVGNPDPDAGSPLQPNADPAVVPMAVTAGGQTDVYYSDLDEDWDPDGDGILAETWAETGYPDLPVGRISPVGGYIDDIDLGLRPVMTPLGVVIFEPHVIAVSRTEKLRAVFEKIVRYDTEIDKRWRYQLLAIGSYMFGADDGNPAALLDETARLIEEDEPLFSDYTLYQDGTPFGLTDAWFDGAGSPEASGALVGTDSLANTSTAIWAWSSLLPGMVFWRGHGSPTGTEVGGGGNGANSTKDGSFIHRTWVLDPTAGGFYELDDDHPAVVFSDSCSNFKVALDDFAAGAYDSQRLGWSNLAATLHFRGAVAVAAATEVTWLLTTPPEDPSIGYGDWYQRRWLRKLARGQAFGDAFIKGKRTAQETFATEKKPNLLKNWLRINLLGDPTQGMFLDADTLEDDAYDAGGGNDTDESATVVHSGVPVRRDGVDLTVRIDGAVAKDADWYVLDGLGTAPKDIQVELRWDASLGDLDLQVLNANRETIAGTKARGRDRITFQSTGQGTAREVLVKVHSPTHVVDYDVEVSVDLQ